jgi:hypothetical protein
MKMVFFLPALVICVLVDLFFAGLEFYALVFRGGILNLDFNHYHEGWFEFALFLLFGLLGVAGLIYVFRSWLKERSSFLEKHRMTVVIVLCILSFLAATGALVLFLIISKG